VIVKECESENTKTKIKKQNKTQIKFNSINPIHQTNANQIIKITMNDVQSVKV